MKNVVLMMLALVCVLLAAPAGASVITWDTPLAISGPEDVLTTGYGSVVEAWNVGGSASTVSGIEFAYAVSKNASGVTGGTVYTLSYAGPPTSDLAYDDLLRGAQASCNYMDLGKGAALVHGRDYMVQIWVQDARTAIGFDRETVLTTGTNTVNVPHLNGASGLGHYVVGHFTYDENETFGSIYSLRIELTGTDASDSRSPSDIFALVNAYAVYEVPEPASLSLMSIGLVCLARRKRS